jgi:hypothetical protein
VLNEKVNLIEVIVEYFAQETEESSRERDLEKDWLQA